MTTNIETVAVHHNGSVPAPDLMTLADLTEHLANGGEATCRCSFLTTRYEPALGGEYGWETVVYDSGPQEQSAPYVFLTAEDAAREAIRCTNPEWHWGECDGTLHATGTTMPTTHEAVPAPHLDDADRLATLITTEDDERRVADLGMLPDDGVGGGRAYLYRVPADSGPADGGTPYAKTWAVIVWCDNDEWTTYEGHATQAEALQSWAEHLVGRVKCDAPVWARELAERQAADEGIEVDLDGVEVDLLWPPMR